MKAFEGDWAFMSNFTHVPHGIHEYPTVEHFFVAMKTTSKVLREHIKVMFSPGQVKRYGRDLDIRSDWNEIKLEVMEYALRIKFKEGTRLAQQLLDTGSDDLVEYNYWHDNFWGECTCSACYDLCLDAMSQNHLGILLMKIRNELVVTVSKKETM